MFALNKIFEEAGVGGWGRGEMSLILKVIINGSNANILIIDFICEIFYRIHTNYIFNVKFIVKFSVLFNYN